MNFLSKIPGPFLVFLGACTLSFEESYTYKIENGISLFKKNLKK